MKGEEDVASNVVDTLVSVDSGGGVNGVSPSSGASSSGTFSPLPSA